MNRIEDIVLSCMSEITGLDSEELQEIKDDNLFGNGILDSLSLVNLVSSIEDKINKSIDISKVDVSQFCTINSIINYLNNY